MITDRCLQRRLLGGWVAVLVAATYLYSRALGEEESWRGQERGQVPIPEIGVPDIDMERTNPRGSEPSGPTKKYGTCTCTTPGTSVGCALLFFVFFCLPSGCYYPLRQFAHV